MVGNFNSEKAFGNVTVYWASIHYLNTHKCIHIHPIDRNNSWRAVMV